MRGSRRSSTTLRAWLIALGVPLVLLFAFFSLMPYSVLIGLDRFHIAPREADMLARWFDRRPGQGVDAKVEVYAIDVPRSTGSKCPVDDDLAGSRPMIMGAEGFRDTVSVRRTTMTKGGWVIVFDRERLFRSQRSIMLLPANATSIRAKYAQVLCDELRLVAPEISFVRLRMCGNDAGLFLKEERITPEFMEKRNHPDAVIWRQGFAADRPDLRLPEVKRDQRMADLISDAEVRAARGDVSSLDTNAFAAFMLLQCAEQRLDPLLSDGVFMYDAASGRASPIYRSERDNDPFSSGRALGKFGFGAMAGSQRMRRGVIAIAERLRQDSAGIALRLDAMDAMWLPIIAKDVGIGRTRAVAARVREEFLHHLFHPDPETLFGSAVAVDLVGDKTSIGSGPALLDPWLDRFRTEADTLRFPRDNYNIEQDLIVPRGLSVVMEKGARFTIAAGKSLVINGALIVRGTGLNPVFIRPADDAMPFGSIAVQGDGKTLCSVHGLRISGGSEAWIDGRYHSGMLSFHYCDVELDHCAIDGSHADDAVNVKHGKVSIHDCQFHDAHADMVDLDFAKGTVERCIFTGSQLRDTSMVDLNGDGLDVSGSHVLVSACTFSALPDKGVSIGEASQVVILGCTFDRDRLAMAVKDLSIAHVDASTFSNNEVVFAVYRKKPVFGGAFVTLYNNEFTDNSREREVDKLSTIVTREKHDAVVWRSFGIEP